jgi:hypothetical protein
MSFRALRRRAITAIKGLVVFDADNRLSRDAHAAIYSNLDLAVLDAGKHGAALAVPFSVFLESTAVVPRVYLYGVSGLQAVPPGVVRPASLAPPLVVLV